MPNRIVLAILLAAATACAPAIDTTIGDAALTAAVATALLNSPQIDGALIDISTEGGVVHLGGTQPTAESAAMAVSIVRGVQGVRDVQSAIAVGSAPLLDTDPVARHPE